MGGLLIMSNEFFPLNGNVSDVLVDYNTVDKSDIKNIHKYLITKKSIK